MRWVLRVGVVVTIIHQWQMVVVIGVIGIIVVSDGHQHQRWGMLWSFVSW